MTDTSMSAIAKTVLQHHPGVRMRDIRGPCRFRKIVRIRHLIIREISKHNPGLSRSQIGRFLNRDASTVYYAVKGKMKRGRSNG